MDQADKADRNPASPVREEERERHSEHIPTRKFAYLQVPSSRETQLFLDKKRHVKY